MTHVRTSRPADDVLLIELDRSERHNALDLDATAELVAAFTEVAERVVIISGRDPGRFCAGADLEIDDRQRLAVSDRLYELYELMVRLPSPIIAAIDGPAVGGGAQLAVACDVRIASQRSSFRFLGVGHGLVVGAWALPALVGRGVAFDLCATMRTITAGEAARVGLVNRVVDDPKSAAVELAKRLLASDAGALTRLKATIAIGDRESALAAERAGNRATWDGRRPPPINPEDPISPEDRPSPSGAGRPSESHRDGPR